jgi:hypothetical protein
VVARNVAKHHTMHKTAPYYNNSNTTKNIPAQNSSSAQVKQLSFKENKEKN